VYQVLAVLLCIFSVTAIDLFIGRGAESRGDIRWGEMPERSQYALFILAVTFTWLMGLMGFARSGIRQHWHIWEVMRDTSPYAATPALGYAANMISACVLVFLGLVAFIFWLGGLAERAVHKGAPAATVETVPLDVPAAASTRVQPATGD
jgi:cytochrome bd ubiquinol oxidase subunit I